MTGKKGQPRFKYEIKPDIIKPVSIQAIEEIIKHLRKSVLDVELFEVTEVIERKFLIASQKRLGINKTGRILDILDILKAKERAEKGV